MREKVVESVWQCNSNMEQKAHAQRHAQTDKRRNAKTHLFADSPVLLQLIEKRLCVLIHQVIE